MNLTRRQFLALSPPLAYTLTHLPQQELWTYGAWLLPVNSDPLNYTCLELSIQTGTRQQMEDFFAGLQGFWGRGLYGFLYPRQLTGEEITALRGLFEEQCVHLFPLIQNEAIYEPTN